jgi:aryl-alcohol dehydrogenase-like predicted oxidoreductase
VRWVRLYLHNTDDKGYTKIYSNAVAFAALKTDGSIKAWGEPGDGGTNAPDGKGYTKIYSNTYAFAALKADGSIKAWGSSDSGGTNAHMLCPTP